MAVEAIAGILTVLALAVVFYGPWQWICTDMARQKAFEKRDAIFDIAARGDLAFDSREYRTIRHALEKTIRYAHTLTLPYFFYVWFAYRIDGRNAKTELFSSIEAIENDAIRREVGEHVRQAIMATLGWTLLRSAVGLLVIVPLALGMKMVSGAKNNALRVGKIAQAEAEAVDRLKIS